MNYSGSGYTNNSTYKGLYLKSELKNKASSLMNNGESKTIYPVGDNFVGVMVGKPGSGKSSLITEMLSHQNIWFQKFDNIFFLTPSGISGVMPTETNFCTRFDMPWLMGKLSEYDQKIDLERNRDETMKKKGELEKNGDFTPETKMAILQHTLINPNLPNKMMMQNIQPKNEIEMLREKTMTQNQKDKRVLVILDDLIADIKKAENDPAVKALFYNRRHIGKNFEVSILLTSQRYMTIPTVIRSGLTFLIVFQPIRKDWLKIREELFYTQSPTTIQRCEIHLRIKHNFVYMVFEPEYGIFLNFSEKIQ